MDTEKKSPVKLAIRILIIIGLIILLVILSVTIIKLVPKALNAISNLRTAINDRGSHESISVRSSIETYSYDTPGEIIWTQKGAANDGYYTFEYNCSNQNVSIEKINDLDNGSYSLLECGQPFIFQDGSSLNKGDHMIPIRASNSSTEPANTNITISHRDSNNDEIYSQGSTTIKILPTSTTTPPVVIEPEPIPAPVNPVPQSTYHGPADLTVRITGYIPPSTQNGQASYKFQVTNLGQSSSGSWAFSANIPAASQQDQVYNSPLQTNIPAGKTSYFTLRFYPANNIAGQFRVVVDPLNYIRESNENNNQAVI